jgi:biotin transport system ATP-binding protein
MNGISIKNVSYQINGTAILTDVSFKSDAKRIAVLGRNGSAKSTLSRLICGLDRPTQGTIHINDIDVHHNRRRGIGHDWDDFSKPRSPNHFPNCY